MGGLHVLVGGVVVGDGLGCGDVVAVLVLQNIGRNLGVLCYYEILVFECLGVLRREPFQQLFNRVLYLQWKIAKHELIVDHQLVHRRIRHLNLEWEVVFDGGHFRQLQKLLQLLPVVIVIKRAN